MLKSLNVRDFALVHQLDIQFAPGLTVITGESGAGKSILLGALGLVLGDRASTDGIRPGAARADVVAEFDLSGNPQGRSFLEDNALDDVDQPGRCLVRRVVNQDGRSKAFINGTPVTRQLLRVLCQDLVDIHGQQEHQRLADRAVQLSLLDDYGVARRDLKACAESYRAWQQAGIAAQTLQDTLASKEDRAALLSYQLEELTAAAVTPGEFEQTETLHRRLSQVQNLREVTGQCLAALEDSDLLGSTLRQLDRIDDDHAHLGAARELLASAVALADDAQRELRGYAESLEADPEQLQALDERLGELHDLARKHHVQPEQLPEHMALLERELTAISTDRGALDELLRATEAHRQSYLTAASSVSEQRQEAAGNFAAAVSRCMNTLGIEGGAMELRFTPGETERGVESVEFYCVTNPKYAAAPLTRIASGGERARISLAIQVVAAERSNLPCLILDEADVGVGGTTADVVGRLLRALAEHSQVICVTHAPQVAALGQHHLRVHKTTGQETAIESLTADSRIDELARMLAGADITQKSRDYAQTLLTEAAQSQVH